MKNHLYFAYGSNMSKSNIESRLGKVEKLFTARLTDYDLIFNKRSKDQSGKLNLISHTERMVMGVCYKVSPDQLTTLDGHEKGYERITVSVLDSKNQSHHATTYFCRTESKSIAPTPTYLETVISGATENQLPDDYIQHIREIAK